MFKAFWGMEFNPFDKSISEKNCYKSIDYSQASARIEHLKHVKGIGLFTGLSGVGKTFTLRCAVAALNPNLYKVAYIPLSTVTVMEFYRSLAFALDLEPASKKIDLFRLIQERIISLAKDKRIIPFIVIDELCTSAHNSSYVGYIFMWNVVRNVCKSNTFSTLHST